MERLPESVQTRVCTYLNATDLINVCEAIPCMKQVLKSATLRGTLRNYVRQMQWVDETLHRGLYSTIAKMKAEADGDFEVRRESEAEAETEAEVLCKAIRYYQEDYQHRAKCLNQKPPPDKMVLVFLLLGGVMSDLEDTFPFLETMKHWTDEHGQPLFEDCTLLCGISRITLTMSNFRIHLDVYTEAPDWEGTHLPLWPMAIERYDGFVYLVNSTMHCHVRHRLPYYLKRLMQNTTKIVCDGKRPLPALLILDTLIGQKCSHADCLVTNLHTLDDGTLGGFTRFPPCFWPCSWWRVWRMQQEDKKLVNLYEAFQWAALQLAKSRIKKGSQGQKSHYSNVAAQSPLRRFK
ncbi:expressed protein [Echinococcus multilocularis]|uniref:Expressed protein n=1 Tax=Echinococcus multilocularis TaxID=6211 RepID=A0A068XXE8_ECHMU|nr:expressed protein [Echinococcus multilocularis]